MWILEPWPREAQRSDEDTTVVNLDPAERGASQPRTAVTRAGDGTGVPGFGLAAALAGLGAHAAGPDDTAPTRGNGP